MKTPDKPHAPNPLNLMNLKDAACLAVTCQWPSHQSLIDAFNSSALGDFMREAHPHAILQLLEEHARLKAENDLLRIQGATLPSEAEPALESEACSELEPCPFCNSPADDFNPDGDMEGYVITCSGEGASLMHAKEPMCPMRAFSFERHADAVKAWNTRAGKQLTSTAQALPTPTLADALKGGADLMALAASAQRPRPQRLPSAWYNLSTDELTRCKDLAAQWVEQGDPLDPLFLKATLWPDKLPCDIKLAPGTTISKGVAFNNFMLALDARLNMPEDVLVFDKHLNDSIKAHAKAFGAQEQTQ